MTMVKAGNALSFFSPSRDAYVYATDLPKLSDDDLDQLESEVLLAKAKVKGDIDWLDISSPSEWPDEGWPQRLCRYSAYLDLFATVLAKRKRAPANSNDTAALKKSNKALLHDLHKQKSFVKMLLMVVQDRYGRSEMLNLKREARALAETVGMKLNDDHPLSL
jgi:hypothetical protein